MKTVASPSSVMVAKKVSRKGCRMDANRYKTGMDRAGNMIVTPYCDSYNIFYNTI